MIPAEEQAQRRAALRALLLKSLLIAETDAEMLMLVRRHSPNCGNGSTARPAGV